MVGKTRHQNAADRERMKVMAEIPCLACMIQGVAGVPGTVQHVTEGGQRPEDEHQHTYKSCPWHHLGEVPATCKGDVRVATKRYGPSFAHSKREFAYFYGTEEELVMIQDSLIRIVQSANRRGEYLTPETLCELTRMLHSEVVAGISPNAARVYEA